MKPKKYLLQVLMPFSVLIPETVFATDFDLSYLELVEANPSQDNIVCAYTMTRESSEESEVLVERYSPETAWRLVTIDGRKPSESELAEYAEEADKRASRRTDPTDLTFLTTIRSESVRLVQDNEKTVEVAFKPELGGEMPDEMEKKMNGRLTVVKDGLRPERIFVSLNEPASPMTGVKIRTFEQEATFVKDHVTGATLLKSISSDVRGRAFVVKRIATEERVVFSDFDCKLIEERSAGS